MSKQMNNVPTTGLTSKSQHSIKSEVRAVINPSLCGWVLVPTDDNALPIVAKLYGTTPDGYQAMKASDRGTMKDNTVNEFLAHVKDIAKDMKIGMSVCGSKTNPTVRLWDRTPNPGPRPRHFNIDLKWSIWSKDEGSWSDYDGKEVEPAHFDDVTKKSINEREIGKVNGADIWAAMQAAFEGTGPAVVVNSCPRKEGRSGEVVIQTGRARGVFSSCWDEIMDLADTFGKLDDDGNWADPDNQREELGLSEDEWNDGEEEAFRESIPFSQRTWEPGQDVDFDVKARSFARLMEKIDAEEDRLIKKDEEEWKTLEEIYKGYRKD